MEKTPPGPAQPVAVTTTGYRYRIADMAVHDRPRERLWDHGARHLTTPELIAILLRTGMRGRSAIDLATDLLRDHGQSLSQLATVTVEELAAYKGIGRAKATQLKAAFELARRLAEPHETRARIIDSPAAAAAVLREEVRGERREVFLLLLLNTRHGLIRKARVSLGSLNASIVEPREVFLEAIKGSAAAVVLAHNHPSGDPTPSREDIALTKRLVQGGELLHITVLDHIILGRHDARRAQDYVSLKELGLM